MRTRAGREALAKVELSPAGLELVALALRMIETIDDELAPLDRALSLYARHQPGCRALIARLYGGGPVTATAIVAEVATRADSAAPPTPPATVASTSPCTSRPQAPARPTLARRAGAVALCAVRGGAACVSLRLTGLRVLPAGGAAASRSWRSGLIWLQAR